MYEAIPEQSPNIMMDIINKAIHLVTVMYMAVCRNKGLYHLFVNIPLTLLCYSAPSLLSLGCVSFFQAA